MENAVTIGPHEAETISQWAGRLNRPRRLCLEKSSDSRTRSLEAFCSEVRRLITPLEIKVREKGPEGPPGIRIRINIGNHAVPMAPELGPFLEALARLA